MVNKYDTVKITILKYSKSRSEFSEIWDIRYYWQ